jgi:urease accessory protein
LELRPDVILIETDPVLMDMLQRMHLDVEEIDAPFEPESGAYNSVSHSEHHHGHHPHPHGHG